MRKKNKNFVITLLLLTIFSLPLITLADINSYKLEQGIPFIGGAGATLSYGDFNKLFERFITIVYIIAAIAAFIKILIAGIKWYTSGGSSKAISQAKEDIKNGLIGLCFLLLAGILLEFINPNLNKLSDVFKPDAGVECTQGNNFNSSSTAVAELPISNGDNVIRASSGFSGNNGVPLFKQYDSRWGKLPYPDDKHLFADNGCAPTSIAMVITKLTGTTITPADLYGKMKTNNASLSNYVDSYGNSKNYAGIADLYGIRTTGSSDMKSCLSTGGIATAVVNGGYGQDNPCKQLLNTDTGGHMIVITGINDKDGYLNINDPYYDKNEYHHYIAAEENLIKRCATSIWCFTK